LFYFYKENTPKSIVLQQKMYFCTKLENSNPILGKCHSAVLEYSSRTAYDSPKLPVKITTRPYSIVRLSNASPIEPKQLISSNQICLNFYYPSRQTDKKVWSNRFSSSEERTTSVSGDDRCLEKKDPFPSSGHELINASSSQFPSTESRAPISCSTLSH
jgi:hypothetical protein